MRSDITKMSEFASLSEVYGSTFENNKNFDGGCTGAQPPKKNDCVNCNSEHNSFWLFEFKRNLTSA